MTRKRKLVITVSAVAVTVVLGVWLSPRGPSPTGPPFDLAATNLIWIEPGTFTMGSPKKWEVKLWNWPPTIKRVQLIRDEGPQTEVTISRGFWMGKYEVTQGEYLSLMSTNPSGFDGDLNLPVGNVNWRLAHAYCAIRTDRDRSAERIPWNFEYRLPTEAEWEYACRAATTTQFSYGEDPSYINLTDHAWYRENSGSMTHSVGQKRPNPWGLHDMHGNVWEWCMDGYGVYPGGAVGDPTGPASGSIRVFRGGSWGRNGGGCRSASRHGFNSSDRGSDIGFRVVLAPVRP